MNRIDAAFARVFSPRQLLCVLACFLVLGLSASVHAVIEVYDFADEAQRAQYQALTKILRCPKCQNQDIADSNAPIAADMRKEVHRLVLEGKTEPEVVQFMVDRFDEFVTYKPRVTASTYVLWYGPWVLAAIGVGIVVLMVRQRRRSESASAAGRPLADKDSLSPEQRARLAAFIAQNTHISAQHDSPGEPKQ